MEEQKYIPDKGQERILQIYLREKIIPKLVVVLAAPGSGKTTVIVRLLLELMSIKNRSQVRKFLALTFTKRTRQDILYKIEKEGRKDLIKDLEKYVRNFHSLAFTSLFWDTVHTESEINNKIEELAAEAQENVDNFNIFRVKKLTKQIKQSIAANNIEETISSYEENDPVSANVMRAFIDWLNLSYKESRSISYDYALIKFIEKLENGKNPLGIDLSKIDLLIVDEFQDSNPAQMAIVKCILKKNPKMKLLLLGDIDQTIYTWRGTDLVFLDEFINEYSSQGDAYYERVFLENTHRLGKQVLRVSQSLIKSRPGYLRFRNNHYENYEPTPLNIENDHPPLAIEFQSEYSEVRWVIAKIKELVKQNIGINYKDIAVILRSFKFTSFFKKFQFQNARQAAINNQDKEIPYTVKADENHKNLRNVLTWLVYFYKKIYFPRQSAKQQIKSIISHMKPSKTTMQKMSQRYNIIDRSHVVRNAADHNKEHQWDLFFLDFHIIEKIISQKEESFSNIFKEVYSILRGNERCQEFTNNEIEEFLEYVRILELYLSKEQHKSNPVFTILEILILKHIYQVKPPKKSKKAKSKQQAKKKSSLMNFWKGNQGQERKSMDFYYLVKQKSDFSRFQSNQQKNDERQQRQKVDLKYANETDAVHFQTAYGAKGLEFKVVFICSLNYDFEHEQFEVYPKARGNRREGRDDADRERQRELQFNRFILREEEEQRVIYTSLTRTSKYCFLTASEKDNMKPQYSVKHPHFEHIKQNTYSQKIGYDQSEDGKFKTAYEEHLANWKPKKSQKKNEDPKSHTLEKFFKKEEQ